MRHYHLAQINTGRVLDATDSPVMAGFIGRLQEINALADGSPGFVWRLQTAEGDATSLRPYEDDRILFNLSVWQTAEQLREFVYRSMHTEVMRQRKAWFERFDEMYYALWWVPASHL